MKSKKLLIFIVILILSQLNYEFTHAQERTPAPQPSTPSQVSSYSLLEDATALVTVYYKIRRLSGSEDKAQLKPYLEQLGKVLDQITLFKESFTPEKKAKVAKQLDRIKGETVEIAGSEAKHLKKDLVKLTDQIMELVRILAE